MFYNTERILNLTNKLLIWDCLNDLDIVRLSSMHGAPYLHCMTRPSDQVH